MGRQSGDGNPTSLIEFPLDQGIVSYATGFAIGPRLMKAQNVILQARADLQLGRYLDWAPTISNTAVVNITAKGDPSHTNKYLLGLASSGVGFNPQAIGVFNNSFGQANLGLWDAVTGAAYHGAATAPILDNALTKKMPAAWAFWPRLATLYYSHIQCTTLTNTQQFVGGVVSDYATAGGYASALAVHLDRLWIAQPNLANFLGAYTIVKYTDPFDPATIRANNFVLIEDEVRCMGRPSAGDLDASAQAHLVFGCRGSIWVLDGDPTAGNATLRQLTNRCGIQAQSLMVETQHGLICLASDGQLYLIASGASSMQPLGMAVKDQFGHYTDIPRVTYPATLLWQPPYLHVYTLRSDTDSLICDLTDPQHPVWTGPHSFANTDALTSGVMGGTFRPQTIATADALYIAEFGAVNGRHVFVLDSTGTARVQDLTSGYVAVAGHDVACSRVLVETLRQTPAVQLSARIYQPGASGVGLTVVGTPTAGVVSVSGNPSVLTVFTFQVPAHGDGLVFRLFAAAAKQLNVVRWQAELRIEPKQQSVSAR